MHRGVPVPPALHGVQTEARGGAADADPAAGVRCTGGNKAEAATAAAEVADGDG